MTKPQMFWFASLCILPTQAPADDVGNSCGLSEHDCKAWVQDEKQEAADKVAEQPQPSHKEEPQQAPQAQQAQQEPEQKSEAASQPARPHARGQGERYTDIPNSQVGAAL